MNAPFTPVDPHSSHADVTAALLKIISDPAAHKQRLDELTAKQAEVSKQTEALNKLTADTRGTHSAAAAATIVANNRKTALDAREAEIEERAKNLDQNEAKLSAASLQRRENLVTSREQKVAREAERLAAIRTEYEGKLAKLKELAGALG
jgi:DNA repair exonuclease SbcCD ATPase subunit